MREIRGRPLSLWIIVGLHAFLGIRGLLGGGQFLLVPSGGLIGVSPTTLAETPFGDFFVPGLFLFVVFGVLPLLTAYSLYRGHPWSWAASAMISIALLVWVVVEGFVIGFGERLQYLNGVQAVVMLVISLSPSVRRAVG